MKTPSLLLLAALMAVSTAAPAKGAKFRGGGSHHDTSHPSTSHSEPSGSSFHVPRARTQSASEPQSSDPAAQASGAQNTADGKRASMNDRLNAELAAKRAATPSAAPVGMLVAKTPVAEPAPLAANEQRLTKPVTVGKVAAISPTATADLTTLAPKDSARPHVDEVRSNDRYNTRGVNCSIYPARC